MILIGNCLERLREMPSGSVQCCVTSPPYHGLRDYGMAGQIGLEETPDAYVARLVEVFREVSRVLKGDGVMFLNLGDCYGSGKQLQFIPTRVAMALQADGWIARSEIVWHKPNPMPESVRDRPTCSHEKVFLFAKSARYYYDAEAIREPATSGERFHGAYDKRPGATRERNGRDDADNVTTMRNCRNVWTITPKPFKGAHFAVMPPELVDRCIKAGSRPGDTVLDPFGGSGTTGMVALNLGRRAVLIELNPAYADLARERMGLLLAAAE